MKLVVDIPKEFEEHYDIDKFADSLHRLEVDTKLGIDIGALSGNYELELVVMLKNAFQNAYVAEDKENGLVLHNLKENPNDLPEKCGEYLTNIGVLDFDNALGNKWLTPLCEACDYYEDVTDEVTVWCELPKLE